MLKNFVLETANAPGTSTTFNLGGAASGRLSFSGAGFTNGQVVFYVMDDGSQKEWGVGTFNTGSPNTMSRTTVIGNSAGTTARLNFSGTTNVYNGLPAENTIYKDNNSIVKLGGAVLDLGAPGNITANSSRVLLRGHLNGFITSRNAGTPNTKIDISVGAAMDEVAQAGLIVSNGVLTIDAGTVGANGIDTGVLANNTPYHVHCIGKTDGTVAGFLSTSLTPTLPSGYTLRRRLGSVQTDGSAHFLDYAQTGDEFIWKAPILFVNVSSQGTSPVSYAVAPAGVKLLARLRVSCRLASAPVALVVGSPDETLATGTNNYTFNLATNVLGFATIDVRTDASGQVQALSTVASTTLQITTYGWFDTRGRIT